MPTDPTVSPDPGDRDREDMVAVFTDEDFERYERELPAALGSVVEAFPAPASDLVARSLARGRRRRRARTLRRSAMALVLVAAGVGGWAATDGGLGRSSSDSADRTRFPSAGDVRRELVPYLTKVLPPEGVLTGAESRFEADAPMVLRTEAEVSGTYATAAGKSSLIVSISRPVPGSRIELGSHAYCTGVRPDNECVREPRPEGGTLTVRKSTKKPGSPDAEWSVVHTRADGAMVGVRVSGAYDDSGEVVGGPNMSIQQITDIARSPVWAPVIAAEPTAGEQVLGLVPALLPGGIRLTSRDGDSRNGEFVVQVGGGRHLLTVAVDPTPPGEGQGCPPGRPEGTGGEVTLPDGNPAVVDLKRNVDGRVVPPSLIVYRPHGLRIRFEVDAPPAKSTTSYGELAADSPGLDLEVLKVIAASPRWDTR
ncbi:hypothetical protein [Embleya hyalina]|uniref:Uncharacterized protein n=1 Tax=Embleya hyalina TaxID=516124 RepID=A0A401YQ69_9ACTN|nr:hypothetical protein [Embleya hyalina]GCD96748.1 hypothetical protein EHYA_04435 [Embleya hyalina]